MVGIGVRVVSLGWMLAYLPHVRHDRGRGRGLIYLARAERSPGVAG